MRNMPNSKEINNTKLGLRPLVFAKMAEMTVESKDHLMLKKRHTDTIF